MKIFYIVFYFFSILHACTITFFDKVKSHDTTYGRMRFHKEFSEKWSLDGGMYNHVFFLNKNCDCVGEAIACCKHCNATERHKSYDAYVIKKESFGKQEYHICVYNSRGQHEFDMIVAKDEISKNYAVYVFIVDQHLCIFIKTELANSGCCCTFPGNCLVELLQKDLVT